MGAISPSLAKPVLEAITCALRKGATSRILSTRIPANDSSLCLLVTSEEAVFLMCQLVNPK